jgi:hypothetical protein
MILDNVKFHHAKKLKPFLERMKDKIELYSYLLIVQISTQLKEFGGI